MKSRRFVADTITAALRQVKDALGPEAIILETTEEPGQAIVTAAAEAESDEASLAGEVRQLAGLVRELLATQSELVAAGLTPPVRALHRALVAQGVNAVIAAALVREIAAQSVPDQPVRTALSRMLAAGAPPAAARVQLFVGLPGDGKTTTIVKLAARLRQAGRTVAVVGADTFRVGGGAELDAYGRALGLHVERIGTPAELAAVLGRTRRADHVLIDTPGAGPGQAVELRELSVLRRAAGAEGACVLVASATAAHQAAARTCETFAALAPDACVLTKLDAASPAPMLGVLWDRHLAVSHLAAGRRIPHDIEPATPARLAHCFLSGGGLADG